jgi:prepilin-type N-terminal cleavage/methylation domain-containing protein
VGLKWSIERVLRRFTRVSDDAGFGLIEMMVSLVILGMVSAGFAYGLQLTLTVTQEDRARVQASNLAARELEIVRNQFGASKTAPTTIGANSLLVNPNPLNPAAPTGSPLDLDGQEFTVVRTVEWLPSGTGTSPCDGGEAVTYPSLGVNVVVSWNDRGVTKDVESNTVLTPPKGTLATIKGFIAAKVEGADSKGVASLPVDISGPGGSQTRVTAADGCAVFALSVLGNYTVTLDEPGYVAFDGQPTTWKLAEVTNGSIQIVPFSYDAAATLELDDVIADNPGPGFQLPTGAHSVVIFNPGLPTMGQMIVPGDQATVTGLWPYPDGYSVWAGRCTVNDPAATGGTRADPIAAGPGDTEEAPVQWKPLRVTYLDVDAVPVEGAQIQATIDDPDGCNGQTTYTLGTTDDDGVVESALPYGQWTLSANQASPSMVDVSADPAVVYPLEVPLEKLQAG